MKKLILISAFLVLVCTAFGQEIPKGSIIAISTYTNTLNPDVTTNQYVSFFLNKFKPEFEKSFPGVKVYLIGGDRGEKKNQIGELLYFESAVVRNKYFPAENDTAMSAAWKAGADKMKALTDEQGKFFMEGGTRTYTDWVIK